MTGRGSVMVMPELSQHIADELAKESQIMKGKLKTYEMRSKMKDALAKGKKAGEDKN